jgi:hypothetical protein
MTWLTGWAKRRSISIDHSVISENLTNFPLLLTLSASCGKALTDLSSIFTEIGNDNNRKKIAITLEDGTTQLYIEIEKWDSANRVALLWVSSPTFTINSSTNTMLYIYYDSTHADNTSYVGDKESAAAVQVWDTNYKMVQHMNEAAVQVKDSTSNNNDGSQGGHAPNYLYTGKVGFGVQLNGTNDRFRVTGLDSEQPTAFTIEAWAKTPVNSGGGAIFPKSTIYVNTYMDWGLSIQGHKASVRANINTPVLYEVHSAASVDDGNWHHLVGVYNGTGGLRIYVDGVQDGSLGHAGGTCKNYANYANIGVGEYLQDQYEWWFNGILDEVRYSNIGRSASWIRANYYSQVDNMVSYGAEEGGSQPQTWLTGWNNRKALSITHAAGAGTNYQICVYAHYGTGTDSHIIQGFVAPVRVYLNNHSRIDFKDVRFTKSDQSTLLKYCMVVEKDSDYAIFWIKIEEDLSTTDTTIYMYYGKADASDASDRDNTFIAAYELKADFLAQLGVLPLTTYTNGADLGDCFISSKQVGSVYISPCIYMRNFGGKRLSLNSSLLHFEGYTDYSSGEIGIDIRITNSPIPTGWRTSMLYIATSTLNMRVLTVVDYNNAGSGTEIDYFSSWATPDDIPSGNISSNGFLTSSERYLAHYGINSNVNHIKISGGSGGGINIYSLLIGVCKYVTPEPSVNSSNTEEGGTATGVPNISTYGAVDVTTY